MNDSNTSTTLTANPAATPACQQNCTTHAPTAAPAAVPAAAAVRPSAPTAPKSSRRNVRKQH